MLQLSKTSAERRRGRRQWFTRQGLIEKYKSAEVADRIIANKMATEESRSTQTKPHPDDPDNEVAHLVAIAACIHGWDELLNPT